MLEIFNDLVYIVGLFTIMSIIVIPMAILGLKCSVKRQRAKDDYYEKIIPGYERITIKK